MTKELSQVLRSLGTAGWKINVRQHPALNLNPDFLRRYPAIPGDYVEFLSNVVSCTNRDETVWFLCEDDLNRTRNSVFGWDEFEVQSLEAAGADEQWRSRIKEFWDRHLPILLSVKSDYEFLCIVLSEPDYGAIAYGYEPEYEEVEKICDSFSELTRLLPLVVEGEITLPPLSDFV